MLLCFSNDLTCDMMARVCVLCDAWWFLFFCCLCAEARFSCVDVMLLLICAWCCCWWFWCAVTCLTDLCSLLCSLIFCGFVLASCVFACVFSLLNVIAFDALCIVRDAACFADLLLWCLTWLIDALCVVCCAVCCFDLLCGCVGGVVIDCMLILSCGCQLWFVCALICADCFVLIMLWFCDEPSCDGLLHVLLLLWLMWCVLFFVACSLWSALLDLTRACCWWWPCSWLLTVMCAALWCLCIVCGVPRLCIVLLSDFVASVWIDVCIFVLGVICIDVVCGELCDCVCVSVAPCVWWCLYVDCVCVGVCRVDVVFICVNCLYICLCSVCWLWLPACWHLMIWFVTWLCLLGCSWFFFVCDALAVV